jgi:hypothetical protein
MKKAQATYTVISVLMVLFLGTIVLLVSSFTMKDDDLVFKLPIIKTSRQKTTLCLSPQCMMNAWYDIECVKAFCSEFNPDQKHKGKLKYHEFYDKFKEGKEHRYSTASLQLVVDTIQEIAMTKRPIWASYLFHQNLGGDKTILQDDTLIQDVKSFPVYLANMSMDKTATVETQDGSLVMVTEAKDDRGNWKPLEYWSYSWCGNSYFSLEVEPQHFVFTRGIKCSGDFYTTCRLKLLNAKDSLYSNEFKMTINRNQFTKPIERKRK